MLPHPSPGPLDAYTHIHRSFLTSLNVFRVFTPLPHHTRTHMVSSIRLIYTPSSALNISPPPSVLALLLYVKKKNKTKPRRRSIFGGIFSPSNPCRRNRNVHFFYDFRRRADKRTFFGILFGRNFRVRIRRERNNRVFASLRSFVP